MKPFRSPILRLPFCWQRQLLSSVKVRGTELFSGCIRSTNFRVFQNQSSRYPLYLCARTSGTKDAAATGAKRRVLYFIRPLARKGMHILWGKIYQMRIDLYNRFSD